MRLPKYKILNMVIPILMHLLQIGKRAKIRNRYNQAQHLTQDTK